MARVSLLVLLALTFIGCQAQRSGAGTGTFAKDWGRADAFADADASDNTATGNSGTSTLSGPDGEAGAGTETVAVSDGDAAAATAGTSETEGTAAAGTHQYSFSNPWVTASGGIAYSASGDDGSGSAETASAAEGEEGSTLTGAFAETDGTGVSVGQSSAVVTDDRVIGNTRSRTTTGEGGSGGAGAGFAGNADR